MSKSKSWCIFPLFNYPFYQSLTRMLSSVGYIGIWLGVACDEPLDVARDHKPKKIMGNFLPCPRQFAGPISGKYKDLNPKGDQLRDCSGYLLIPKEDHARADNSKGSTLTLISFSLNKTKDMSIFCLVIGFILCPNRSHFKNTAANACII